MIVYSDENQNGARIYFILLGLGNGGTTATAKCFLQNPSIDMRSNYIRDHGLEAFYDVESEKSVCATIDRNLPGGWEPIMPLYSKGYGISRENIFISFIFRNPVYVLNSWVKRGTSTNNQSGLLDLMKNYEQLERTRREVQQEGLSYNVINFEDFLGDPGYHLKPICGALRIPFKKRMIWRDNTGAVQWGRRKGVETIDRQGLQPSYSKRLVLEQRIIDSIEQSKLMVYYSATCRDKQPEEVQKRKIA